MVKGSPGLSAGKISQYYTVKSASVERNYFAKDAPGTWLGEGAAAMGLTGPISQEILDRIALGQTPDGIQVIAHRPPAKEKTPEWVGSDVAWKSRIEEMLSDALLESDNPFARQEKKPGDGGAVRAKDAQPPAAGEYSERELKLIEIHEVVKALYAENLFGPEGEAVRKYLQGRGITKESATEFGLGLSLGGDQLRERLASYDPELLKESGLFNRFGKELLAGRLIFPIQDASGNTIAFAGRKSDDEAGPKYINSPETAIYKKGETLYSLHRASQRAIDRGEMVVVEGYMDVIAAHQAKVKNVVALSGTALSEEQAKTIASVSDRAVLLLDTDKAGKNAAERSVETLLDVGLGIRSVKLSDGKDAAQYLETHKPAEFRREIKASDNLVEYLAAEAQARFSGADVYSKVDAVKWVQEKLEQVPAAQREEVHAQLAKQLGIKLESKIPESSTSEHIAAWDLTVSAPKSISVTALVGSDQRIIRAHEEAAKIAAKYAERFVQVKMGGSSAPETTGKAVMSLFVHDSARPVDGYSAPQLHTHMLFANMSQDSTGKWRALNPQELFKLQSTMEAIYQNELAVRLKSFGYKLTYGKNNSIEIVGYTPEYLTAESPRANEIEAEKERRGEFGPEANQRIALETRNKKDDKPPEQVRAEQKARAAEYGDQPNKVVAEAKESKSVVYSQAFRRNKADEGIQFAKSRLSERTTVMEEYEIYRDALKYGRGYVTLPDVEAAFSRAKEQFVQAHHWREHAPGARYSTPELIRKERFIAAWMANGRGQFEPMLRGMSKDQFRAEHSELKDHQKHALWNVLNSSDRMFGIQGVAGSGKTRMLAALKDYIEKYNDIDVMGVSATTSAVGEMQAEGIPAQTLASFVQERSHGATKPRVYFMDEASLSDVHQSAEVLRQMRPCDRVIPIGDTHQHGSVGAGKVFAELQMAGMATHRMTVIVRQQTESYKQSVKHLSQADIPAALKIWDDEARIHVFTDERKRFEAAAKIYLYRGPKSIVVAPDNASQEPLGAVIQEYRRQAGQVATEVYRARILDQRKDLTETDMQMAFSYQIGNVVQFNTDNKTLKVKRGDYAQVVSADHETNRVKVMHEKDGRIFDYNPKLAATNATLYVPTYREFSVGDRIQFTKQWKEWIPDAKNKSKGEAVVHAPNGALGTIEKLDQAGNVTVRMDRGDKVLAWNLDQFSHVKLGYVTTSYKSQSMTADNVIGLVNTDAPGTSKLLTEELLYVMSSRGRDNIDLVSNVGREELETAFKPEQKPMALAEDQVKQYRTASQGMTV